MRVASQVFSSRLQRCGPTSSFMGRRCSTVSAAAVKELRAKTSAPLMDCKKALAATDGTMAAAIDWLRAKGIARASSGADRVALEGLIALHMNEDGSLATLVEINSETDFVSRNKDFQSFCAHVAAAAASSGALDSAALMQVTFPSSSSSAVFTVKDALGDIVSLIRENIVVKRIQHLRAGQGERLAGYMHGRLGEGLGPSPESASRIHMGKTGAVVVLSSSGAAEAEATIGRRLAMHVVAAKPSFLSVDSVPADVLQRESEIYRQQSQDLALTKPPDVVEKVIRGKVLKRLGEICLLSQVHVAVEGGPVVGKYLQGLAPSMVCKGFVRWTVGSE